SVLPQLLVAVNQLGSFTAEVVEHFDVRGLASSDGFRATRGWLIAFGRMSPAAASGWLRRGQLLRQLPVLAGAARAGKVSAEQLSRVADPARQVGVGQVVAFAAVLAELASQAGPRQVQPACQRIHAQLDPDGKPPDPARDLERRQ